MRWSPLVLPLAVFIAPAAETAAPESQLLNRVRYHMSQTLTNLPNYTCLQTIERSQRLAPKKKPSLQDVVRIEVALVEGKELFSWPGTGKFVDTEINKMVRGGAIGTGSFALHARAVFMGNAATYKYEGTQELNGRTAHKWTFSVPQIRSSFLLRDGINEAVIAYDGAFWIDAATLDAARLEVHGREIPPTLRIESTADAVEYRRMRIGTEDFLLPQTAELHMIDREGSESINRTTFSHCRQYSGESRLLLDEEAEAIANSKAPEPERLLDAPPKLTLDLSLITDVVLRTTAVGDPVTAALQRPLKVGTGVTIPKGALVHGRITGVRRGFYIARIPASSLALDFTEIESPGWRIRINATMESVGAVTPEILNSRLGPVAPSDGETIQGSLLFLREGTQTIRRGLRMMWVTRPLRTEDQK